jgi:hypothetical protein
MPYGVTRDMEKEDTEKDTERDGKGMEKGSELLGWKRDQNYYL